MRLFVNNKKNLHWNYSKIDQQLLDHESATYIIVLLITMMISEFTAKKPKYLAAKVKIILFYLASPQEVH